MVSDIPGILGITLPDGFAGAFLPGGFGLAADFPGIPRMPGIAARLVSGLVDWARSAFGGKPNDRSPTAKAVAKKRDMMILSESC